MVINSSANRSGTDSHLASPLERLVLRTFERMLRTPATFKTITDAMLDNPGFIVPVTALVRSEHNLLITEQDKIDARCRQFEQFGTKSDRAKPVQMSEQGEEPPINISDDAKTNHRAYYRSTSQASSKWYDARTRRHCIEYAGTYTTPTMTLLGRNHIS